MELRKRKGPTIEFETLKAKLNDLGLYENGMDFDQMRQVMGAVDESISETSFNNREMDFALRESEREFASANICNSTMIGSSENTNVLDNFSFGQLFRNLTISSPYSSPEVSCVQKITVVAEVHHELNWTPKKSPSFQEEGKRSSQKRTSGFASEDDSGVILSSNSLFETTSV